MANFGDTAALSTSTRTEVGDLFNKVQKGNWYWGGTSGGSANAQTITVEGGMTAFFDGQVVAFNPGFANTASATLSVNGTGVRTMRRQNGNSLLVGDLLTAGIVLLVWKSSSSSWLLISEPSKISETWVPVYGAIAPMSFSAPPVTGLARYAVFGDRVMGTLDAAGGILGGTPTDTWTATLPPIVLAKDPNTNAGACGITHGGGIHEVGRWSVATGVFNIHRSNFSNFQLGAQVALKLTFNYQAVW